MSHHIMLCHILEYSENRSCLGCDWIDLEDQVDQHLLHTGSSTFEIVAVERRRSERKGRTKNCEIRNKLSIEFYHDMGAWTPISSKFPSHPLSLLIKRLIMRYHANK